MMTKEYARNWRAKNRARINETQRSWRKRNADKERGRGQRYYAKHKGSVSERSRAFRIALKKEAIAHYGGICTCCGLGEWQFLSLDHPKNDGAKHRAELGIGAGWMFYAAMKRLGWPPGLQVHCYNCNLAKAHYGQCPHKNGARI